MTEFQLYALIGVIVALIVVVVLMRQGPREAAFKFLGLQATIKGQSPRSEVTGLDIKGSQNAASAESGGKVSDIRVDGDGNKFSAK
jgi:hypothetical protein